MIHHDKITAKRAPHNGEGDSGAFDIIEKEGPFREFSVYEGGYCHTSDCKSLDEATKAAQQLADEFDRRALETLKVQWRNDPSWDIEFTPGFEDIAQELYIFRLETELAAAEKEIQRMRSILLPFGALLDEIRGVPAAV